jgi:hypothetical protein
MDRRQRKKARVRAKAYHQELSTDVDDLQRKLAGNTFDSARGLVDRCRDWLDEIEAEIDVMEDLEEDQ